MQAEEDQQIVLRDGRRLGFACYGAPDGEPVFYFHGFPGSRLEGRLLHATAERLDVRVLAIDRPGYGISDFQPGRTLADWPGDIAQVADALGRRRFRVLGVSGGGPYALAAGAGLNGRVIAVATVCGLGPLAVATGTMGMPRRRQLACALCRRLPWIIPPLLYFLNRRITRNPASVLRYLIEQVDHADRVTLEQPAFAAALLASFGEAVRPGSAGAIRDLQLYLRPWDFDLTLLAAPVMLWHGEQDRTVPAAMSRALALQLPNCEAHILADEGHYSLPANQTETILQALLGAGGQT